MPIPFPLIIAATIAASLYLHYRHWKKTRGRKTPAPANEWKWPKIVTIVEPIVTRESLREAMAKDAPEKGREFFDRWVHQEVPEPVEGGYWYSCNSCGRVRRLDKYVGKWANCHNPFCCGVLQMRLLTEAPATGEHDGVKGSGCCWAV